MGKVSRASQELHLEGEIWKDIPTYIGLYQASSFGRMKSLSRKVQRENYEGIKKERILTPRLNTGYLRVPMQRSQEDKGKEAVHRMVAAAFLGESHLTVDHIDGNKQNNRIENLRYLSHAENVSKAANKKSKYGCSGIDYSKARRKFRARINILGKNIDLGGFEKLEDAISARKEAEVYYKFFEQDSKPHAHNKETAYKNNPEMRDARLKQLGITL